MLIATLLIANLRRQETRPPQKGGLEDHTAEFDSLAVVASCRSCYSRSARARAMNQFFVAH
jgi:hypothetical protein